MDFFVEKEQGSDYDVTEKVRQLNEELAREPALENREQRIKFKENLVDFVAPTPELDMYYDDEDLPESSRRAETDENLNQTKPEGNVEDSIDDKSERSDDTEPGTAKRIKKDHDEQDVRHDDQHFEERHDGQSSEVLSDEKDVHDDEEQIIHDEDRHVENDEIDHDVHRDENHAGHDADDDAHHDADDDAHHEGDDDVIDQVDHDVLYDQDFNDDHNEGTTEYEADIRDDEDNNRDSAVRLEEDNRHQNSSSNSSYSSYSSFGERENAKVKASDNTEKN